MKLSTTVSEIRSDLKGLRSGGASVGLVPTMGALHEGHVSLVSRSIEENGLSVVSIFVNPTQFNEKQDFEHYPRTIEKDLAILDRLKVDLVFAPPAEEVYPEPDTRVFEFGGLDKGMEGRFRPGHFQGVAQVVSRLFEILEPDRAYFGEKDFQQLAIVRKITAGLALPVEIVGCPIVREEDGLAMSSRNRLLTPAQRKSAGRIFQALRLAQEHRAELGPTETIRQAIEFLEQDPAIRTEYFEIVDSRSLEPVHAWDKTRPHTACVAVRIGSVRLIDNMDFSF